MKWFKHYENANTNMMIQHLLSQKNGHELHSMYWLLLELLCGEFKKDTTVFVLSFKQLKSALLIFQDRKLSSFMELLSKSSARFDQQLLNCVPIENDFYKIETPIILELMGKDFKRARQVRGNGPAKKENKNKNKNIKGVTKKADNKKLETLLDFEDIYATYPKKAGKSGGLKICKSQIKTQEQYDNLTRAVKNYAEQEKGTEQKYIKQFSTFMNCWEDFVDIESIETLREKLDIELAAMFVGEVEK